MYKTVSKYPVIKADVTIETTAYIPYDEIERAVELKNWHTIIQLHYSPVGSYGVRLGNRFTTFNLEISNPQRQPSKSDMDAWLGEIDYYLRENLFGRVT